MLGIFSKSFENYNPKKKGSEDGVNVELKEMKELEASPKNELESDKSPQIKTVNLDDSNQLQGKSLYLFDSKSRLRNFLLKVISHNYFDKLIMITIILSCVLLLIRDPFEYPLSTYNISLLATDYIILVIYFTELLMKTIVYGFAFNGEKSFLRNLSNFFDFVLLIMTAIGTLDENLRFSKASLKSFRVVRFVKIIYFFPESKKTMKILLMSIPDLLSVLIFFFLNLLFFGIISMQYFKNSFFFCTNNPSGSINFIKTKWDCLDYGGDWINQDVNFDNIINSVSGIFQLCTTEGWMRIM